ncbi:lysosomal Pro-X carboxypeptidase-like [Carpediemonas membranifera]|uniref:Lysosomal Pro-X carboxypeptidase-like n=1 Tax=Carpediemonas membranifera TaxID=201153 RepID=A0A8J6AV08_9EUKA|nr:lysosomal Pro-X carboxypeptidase-like [Carpediemonas membranifera]|eukprot:KAG9395461.1 lysosomal Pro-X carboxypeptidase-like [Carpediemonas membranifera]
MKLAVVFLLVLTTLAFTIPEPTEKGTFTTMLDNFALFDTRTMNIRYFVYDGYVKNNKPEAILFYTGNESPIEVYWENTGAIFEHAQELSALVIIAEHRYYGSSLPFGARTFKDIHNFAWLSSEQALMDYAKFLDHWKATHPTHDVPVIAFGGSYGGMLAAWMRTKYPHVIAGAIASSAPVALFDGISDPNGYNKIVENDFTCAPLLKQGINAIASKGQTAAGLAELSSIFKTCTPLKSADTLPSLIEDTMGSLAMVSYPYPTAFLTPLPAKPNEAACKRAEAAAAESNAIDAVYEVINLFYNYDGSATCLDISDYAPVSGIVTVTPDNVWPVHTCNEMVFPIVSDGALFPKTEWDLDAYIANCKAHYDMTPRPYQVIHEYGGRRIDGTNIYLARGSLDPWAAGCLAESDIPEEVRDSVIVSVVEGGAHHLDLRDSNPADPASVVEIRADQLKYMKKWIAEW